MKKIISSLTTMFSFIFISINAPIYASDESVRIWSQPNPANQPSANAHISANGRFIAFHSAATNLVSNDTNNRQDIFVYDRVFKVMERVSVHTDDSQADHYSLNPSISGDGRYVAFMSSAENLVDNDANSFTLHSG